MAEPVSELIVAIRADISQLKSQLEMAKSETRKWGRANRQQLQGIRADFKRLKEPISNIGQLANSLGNAFGGAASKVTGLVNGVVSSFAAGGAAGLAIGATTALVTVLAGKFEESRRAAEKARQATVDEQIATAKSVEDAISRADDEIANLKAKLGRGEDAATRASEAAAKDSERNAQEASDAADKKLADARARVVQASKAGAHGSLAAAQEALSIAEKGAYAAGLELERIKANNSALSERLALLRDLRKEAEASDARKPRGEAKWRFRGDPTSMLAADMASPEGNAEYARRRMGLNAAGNVDRVQRDIRVGALLDKDRAEGDAKTAKDAKDAAKEANDELKAAAKNASAAGDIITSNFIDPLVDGTFQIASALENIGKELLKLAGSFVVKALITAVTGIPIPGFARGGQVRGFAAGGSVGTDTVPAMLTPGEFVMPVSAVRALGVDFMENVRKAGRYSSGGVVAGRGVNMGGTHINVTVNGNASPSVVRQLRRELITQGDALSRNLAKTVSRESGLNLART